MWDCERCLIGDGVFVAERIFDDVTFANPHFLWLLGLVPLVGVWAWWRRRQEGGMRLAILLTPSNPLHPPIS